MSTGVKVAAVAVPVIGAVAVYIATQGGFGGGTPSQPVNPPPPTTAESTANVPPNSSTTPNTTPGGTQKAPDPAPLNRPGGSSTPDPVRTNPPAPTNPPVTNPTPPAPMTRLQEWFQELNREGVADARATAIIGEVEQLRPNLTGLTLAEAYFVEMTAYVLLANEIGACRSAREVKRLHTTTSRIEQADRVLTNFCS